MKMLMFMLLCGACYAVYPIIDNDRTIWWEQPVVVETDFQLGLVNPDEGLVYYGFLFKHYGTEIDVYGEGCQYEGEFTVNWEAGSVEIYGIHNGTGIPWNAFWVSGYGEIIVYQNRGIGETYTQVGQIRVVPEPASVLLMIGGVVCLRKRS